LSPGRRLLQTTDAEDFGIVAEEDAPQQGDIPPLIPDPSLGANDDDFLLQQESNEPVPGQGTPMGSVGDSNVPSLIPSPLPSPTPENDLLLQQESNEPVPGQDVPMGVETLQRPVPGQLAGEYSLSPRVL
jgi:hypothetical protein